MSIWMGSRPLLMYSWRTKNITEEVMSHSAGNLISPSIGPRHRWGEELHSVFCWTDQASPPFRGQTLGLDLRHPSRFSPPASRPPNTPPWNQKVDFAAMGQDTCYYDLYGARAQVCSQDPSWSVFDPRNALEGGMWSTGCLVRGVGYLRSV